MRAIDVKRGDLKQNQINVDKPKPIKTLIYAYIITPVQLKKIVSRM